MGKNCSHEEDTGDKKSASYNQSRTRRGAAVISNNGNVLGSANGQLQPVNSILDNKTASFCARLEIVAIGL